MYGHLAISDRYAVCREIFGPGTGNGPAGPNNASYSVPPHHKWSYPARAFQCAKMKDSEQYAWRARGRSNRQSMCLSVYCPSYHGAFLLERSHQRCGAYGEKLFCYVHHKWTVAVHQQVAMQSTNHINNIW